MRFAYFCLALLGLGLAGLITQWGAVLCLGILAMRPQMNLGATAFLPLLPIAITAEVEGDSIMYDLPLALRTLYYHSINNPKDCGMGQWMHQAELILCIAPEWGRLLNALAVAGCAVLLWDMLERTAAWRTAWMSPVIVLTALGIYRIVGSSKMDAWTVFFSFLSAWYYLRWKSFRAGVAMGCAVACKLTALPVLLGLVLFGGFPVRVGLGAAILLIPWMLRQYLTMGTPFFPLTGTAFSEVGYPIQRKAEMKASSSAGRNIGTVLAMIFQMSPISMLGPFCQPEDARLKRMILVAGVGLVGIYTQVGMDPRYGLVLLPWLAVPSMAGIARFNLPNRIYLAYAFIVLLCTTFPYIRALNQEQIPQTYLAAMEACHKKCILGWGEERKYPGGSPRNVMWTYLGQPLFWMLASNSDTPRRMMIKTRQWGVTHLLINPLSLKKQGAFSEAFPWKKENAERFWAFSRQYLFPVWQTSAVDGGGGYALYEIRRKPWREK